GGGFQDGHDVDAGLGRVPHLGQRLGLGQHDRRHAGMVAAGRQVVVVPGGRAVVDAHPQARLGMRPQEVAQRLAGAVLGQVLDRVFQVDDDDVGAGGQRLGDAFGPAGRHEQGSTDDGGHYTTFAVRRRATSAGAYPNDASTASVFSPTAGTASMRGANALLEAGGSSAGSGPAGLPTSRQRWRACNWGWAHTSFISLTRALAIWAASRRSVTCSMVSAANAWTIRARSASRLAARRELEAKRSSSASSGCASTRSQNTRHSRSFCRPSMMVAPSPTGNGPYG